MATISTFTIQKFKGANEVRLDFENRIATPVLTLIGLNESGKTTILEALSYFVSGDNAVSSLFAGASPASLDSLIPIDRKAAFSGNISIAATVNFGPEDLTAVAGVAKTNGFEVDLRTFPQQIQVERQYVFRDSAVVTSNNYWYLEFNAKAPKARKFTTFKTVASKTGAVDLWTIVADVLIKRLPRIAYFPTFLVDLPKKIYLKEHPKEEPVNRYYRLVLQDVLDSLDEGLSLQKHVCDRIDEFRKKDASANWFSILFGGPTKAPIDAVFQKISAAVTKEVLGSWENIFNRKVAAKNISVEWHIDTAMADLPYATFSVSDGASKYAIDQRSLGFRWFFSFLLFTTFKQKTDRATIFVFDEPAANLHAKAQAELLKSFSRITTGENKVVYSTHSHHMINPRWLSGSYIVENTAIDHDSEDAFGLTTKPTNIIATPYRQFVARNPTRISYFQPVIEQLEYVTPELLGSHPFVLVEGISDFYALSYVLRKRKITGFSLMPGLGAGASGPQISSMLGRGERFLILLDDDVAGRSAATRYREDWYLSKDDIVLLPNIDKKFSGASLEKLLTGTTKGAIAKIINKPNASKKEIGWYLAELCANPDAEDPFDEESRSNLEAVLNFVSQRFASDKD